MRKYNIFYFIGQAFSGFWRNGVMSVASVAVLMSLLVVIGGFSLLVQNINLNLQSFGELNEVVVFVDTDATEEEILGIGDRIRRLENIESIRRVTKAEGLAEMKEKYDYYSDVSEEENPLPDSYVITFEDPEKVPELDYQLQQIEGVSKVNNRLDLANTMARLKNGVMIIFVWFLVILAVVSIFVIINTIKLSVFARRQEISIMRYVGASGWFISLPFIIEGTIIGTLAAVLAYFIEWYVYSYMEKWVAEDLQMISVIHFGDIKTLVLLLFLLLGIGTGIVGSCLSLGKYLKR